MSSCDISEEDNCYILFGTIFFFNSALTNLTCLQGGLSPLRVYLTPTSILWVEFVRLHSYTQKGNYSAFSKQ